MAGGKIAAEFTEAVVDVVGKKVFKKSSSKAVNKTVTKGVSKSVPQVVGTELTESGKNFMTTKFPEIDQIAYDSVPVNSKAYNEINDLINRSSEGDINANTLLSDKLFCQDI